MPLPLIAVSASAAGTIWKAWHRRKNRRNDDEFDEGIEKIVGEVIDPQKKEPLPAKPALHFVIAVTSDPPGAQIKVDGDYLSDTPFEVPLTRGKHKISIKIAGRKRWQSTVRVVADGQKIHAKLTKSWL